MCVGARRAAVKGSFFPKINFSRLRPIDAKRVVLFSAYGKSGDFSPTEKRALLYNGAPLLTDLIAHLTVNIK